MRTSFALLPLLIVATPVAAQAPASRSPVDVQRALNDPAVTDRLANVMQSLSNAILNLPVGGLEAAIEGRHPTPAEKQRTVRDMDPGIDRDLQRQIAQAKPVMQQSMKAMSEALPQVMKSLHDAQKSIERAASNMPDPTYPKR